VCNNVKGRGVVVGVSGSAVCGKVAKAGMQ
jgi:hypothetical protein